MSNSNIFTLPNLFTSMHPDNIKKKLYEQNIWKLRKAEELKCFKHKLPLEYYCDSCEDPICKKCLYDSCTKTHFSQHKHTTLEDAYRVRVAKLSQIINSSLLIKRDQLQTQINCVDRRLEEIANVKQQVEKETRVEYGQIVERLTSAEGMKSAVLEQ